MQITDLKKYDYVSFVFSHSWVEAIFSHISKRGNPVFVLASTKLPTGKRQILESQEFDIRLIKDIDLLVRDGCLDYEYVKESLREQEIERLQEEIEQIKQRIKVVEKEWLPSPKQVIDFWKE